MSRRISTALKESREALKQLLREEKELLKEQRRSKASEDVSGDPKMLSKELPVAPTLPELPTTHLEPIVTKKRPFTLNEVLAAAQVHESRTTSLSLTTNELIILSSQRRRNRDVPRFAVEPFPTHADLIAIAYQRHSQANLPSITPQLIDAARKRKIEREQRGIADIAKALGRILNHQIKHLLKDHPDICDYLKNTLIPNQMTDLVIISVCTIKKNLLEMGYIFSAATIKMAFEKSQCRHILGYFIENSLPLPKDITIFFNLDVSNDLKKIMVEHKLLLFDHRTSDQDGTHKLDFTVGRIERRTNLQVIRRQLEEIFKKIDDEKPDQKLTTPLPRFFVKNVSPYCVLPSNSVGSKSTPI